MIGLLRKIGHKSLGILCLSMVLAFHVANYEHDQFLGPIKDWWSRLGSSELALSSSSGDLFSFKFLALGDPPPEPVKKSRPLRPGDKPKPAPRPKLDFANQWLSWSGIFLRTLVDQSQPRWINYRYRGRRYYYLRDEIAYQYKDREATVAKGFVDITRLMNAVVSRAGGTLVITPMPTKLSINRDRLPTWLPEQELWAPVLPSDKTEEPYRVYSAVLRGAPTQTVDAFKIFERYHAAHLRDDLYIPSNHQWTSLGIALTAAGVVENLRARGWALAKPRVVRLPEEGELYDEGLLEILNLPPEFGRFYAQTRRHEPNYGLNRVAKKGSPGRLFIFGTCYSDRMRDTNGFGNVLGRALGRRDVINLSADGGNTIPSFREFKRKYAPFRKDDLVIWEFIVRGTFTPVEIRTMRHNLQNGRKKRRKWHPL